MAMQAPGRRLKRLIDSVLAENCSWDERELVAIGKAVAAEDRAAALQKMLNAELARPEPRSRKVVELSSEIRQLETAVVRLVRELTADPDAVSMPPKSRQHQAAARSRWDSRSQRPRMV